MYTLRTEFTVTPGANREFEAWTEELGELRKKASGGVGQTLLRSYGRPNVYTLMGRYETPQAHWRFANGSAFGKFVKATPAGLSTPGRPQEGYLGVLEVDADTPPQKLDCEILADWTVSLAHGPEFEENRRELFELRKQHQKGFASNRLRRNMGLRTRYLVIQICSDYRSATAAVGPEVADYGRTHPVESYANATGGEIFQVVHRL